MPDVDAFIARAEQRQREMVEWQQRIAREEAEFHASMALLRLQNEMPFQPLPFLMALAMNPRINAQEFEKIATTMLQLPRNAT